MPAFLAAEVKLCLMSVMGFPFRGDSIERVIDRDYPRGVVLGDKQYYEAALPSDVSYFSPNISPLRIPVVNTRTVLFEVFLSKIYQIGVEEFYYEGSSFDRRSFSSSNRLFSVTT